MEKLKNVREAMDAITALSLEHTTCRTPHEALALVILSNIAKRIEYAEVREVHHYLKRDTRAFIGGVCDRCVRKTWKLRERIAALRRRIQEVRHRETHAIVWLLEQVEAGLVLPTLCHLEHLNAYTRIDSVEFHTGGESFRN